MNRLKEIMLEKDISQSQLSKMSGITQSSISDWLNGRYEPKHDKVVLIAKALNTTPAYLMGWEEEISQESVIESAGERRIGHRIKLLREQNRMTQEELANCIDSTKQNIYKYESGVVSDIPLAKIELLAKALNTTPAYLAGWENDSYVPLKKLKEELGMKREIETERDVLVIKTLDEQTTGWKPITVSTEVYEALRSLANETKMPISKLACMVLEFGLERVEIHK